MVAGGPKWARISSNGHVSVFMSLFHTHGRATVSRSIAASIDAGSRGKVPPPPRFENGYAFALRRTYGRGFEPKRSWKKVKFNITKSWRRALKYDAKVARLRRTAENSR